MVGKIAFNQKSLMTRINKLADALAKNLSEPSTSTPQSSQSLEKPPSQKSSQGSSHNGSNEVHDKDSGIGSLGTKVSSSHSNNTVVPENESKNTGLSGSAIFHALPFKDQVQYFSDFLRAAAEKRNQTYPPMIKNKTERQCFWRRSKSFIGMTRTKFCCIQYSLKTLVSLCITL